MVLRDFLYFIFSVMSEGLLFGIFSLVVFIFVYHLVSFARYCFSAVTG